MCPLLSLFRVINSNISNHMLIRVDCQSVNIEVFKVSIPGIIKSRLLIGYKRSKKCHLLWS